MTVERENSKVINNSRLGQLNENTNGADASGEMQLAEAIAIIARHSFDNTDAPPDAKKIIPTPTTPMLYQFRNSARRKCCAVTLTDNPTLFAY